MWNNVFMDGYKIHIDGKKNTKNPIYGFQCKTIQEFSVTLMVSTWCFPHKCEMMYP